MALLVGTGGLFDPSNPQQKALVQRAAAAGLDMVWDQHVGGMAPNAPYSDPGHSSYSWGFDQMGRVTAQWQAGANGSAAAASGTPRDGVRTMVFEENGEPGWQEGLNIHNLARGEPPSTSLCCHSHPARLLLSSQGDREIRATMPMILLAWLWLCDSVVV